MCVFKIFLQLFLFTKFLLRIFLEYWNALNLQFGLIDWIVFYAASAIFQPYNGDAVWCKPFQFGVLLETYIFIILDYPLKYEVFKA